MSWAIDQADGMSAEEIARGPMLCVSDSDFDEMELLPFIGQQAKDANGDRFVKYRGTIIYTHHVNRECGLI